MTLRVHIFRSIWQQMAELQHLKQRPFFYATPIYIYILFLFFFFTFFPSGSVRLDIITQVVYSNQYSTVLRTTVTTELWARRTAHILVLWWVIFFESHQPQPGFEPGTSRDLSILSPARLPLDHSTPSESKIGGF